MPTIPIPGEGDVVMSQPDQLHSQNLSALGMIGTMHMADLKTISKAQDYSYLQGKDLVSLAEAVGVREVASQRNPAGPAPAGV